MDKEKDSKEKDLGISIKKEEDFSQWFVQLILKSELADYTSVSGCIVFKPTSWAVWEKIMHEVNSRIKKMGVKNVNFPLFIPESLLIKEQDHVKGFTPEVAWVTQTGDTKLSEKLAVRPTSEAIMYDSFSKWIRSHRDLPLKYNQWSNVVRWEFKHPVPFFRTREFVFNEGHTVFASKEEAEAESMPIINMYKEIMEKYLAIPGFIGKKTDNEKFAGADYTITIESYLPNGKAIQGPDFHHDGQNFSKAYDIKFLDQDGKEKYAYQNTWAISTRMLGVMFAIHSDNKGLVLPPYVAPNKIVIVPLLFEKDEKVLKKAFEIFSELKNYDPILDDRTEFKPGYKFNDWELKGIPIRIEIGPNDLKNKQVTLVRRDEGKKKFINIKNIKKQIDLELKEMHDNLFKIAQKNLFDNLDQADDLKKAIEKLNNKKIVLVPLSNSAKIEEELKDKTGAKTLNRPLNQPKVEGKKCIISGKQADYWVYIGKSY